MIKNVFTESLQYNIIYAVIIREKYINFGFEFLNYKFTMQRQLLLFVFKFKLI